MSAGPYSGQPILRRMESGCLEWLGGKGTSGHGIVPCGPRAVLAHRFAWELLRGEVPEGMLLRHLCGNPACVEVTHLEPGTQAQNYADAVRHGTIPPPMHSGPCAFDGCGRDRQPGCPYCYGHTQQKYRGQPLRPLRPYARRTATASLRREDPPLKAVVVPPHQAARRVQQHRPGREVEDREPPDLVPHGSLRLPGSQERAPDDAGSDQRARDDGLLHLDLRAETVAVRRGAAQGMVRR